MGALTILAIVLAYALCIVDFCSNEVAVKVYPFCMMACLGGVVSVNWMFRQLPFLQRPFVAIGKNSLTYYAAHWVVLGIASLFVQDIWHLTGYALFVSFVVANVLVLPCLDFVFRKYCPWSIGK